MAIVINPIHTYIYPKMKDKAHFLSAIFLLISLSYQQQTCLEPQKAFYMSYNAMSKRDTLPNLFETINSKIPTYNASYTSQNNSHTYTITSMHPQMYYSEHAQKQEYVGNVDSQHVNVTLGDIELAFRLNYTIKDQSGKEKKGWGRGRVTVDQTAYFIKRLLVKDGFMEWDPSNITNLQVTYPIAFDYSEPTLDHEDKVQLELLLNDHAGDKKLKQQVLATFNAQYLTLLKEHLNTEQIIGTLNISYKYNNKTYDFLNAVKDYDLSNSKVKGLQGYFFFELENHTKNCTPNTIAFDQNEYGGVQEWYSMSTLSETFKYALAQGLYNVNLDKNWEVTAFQFYMGDLSNFMSAANKYQPDQRFDASCKWDDRQVPKVSSYDTHDIFVTTHVICTAKYQGKDLFSTDFDLNLVVRVMGEDDSLLFLIKGANIFQPTWTAIDPQFKISDENLGRYYVAELAKVLNGEKTFGTGWKTLKRKFPVARVTNQYVIVFDPSEI